MLERPWGQISDMQRHLGPKPYLLSDHTEVF